MIDCKLLKEEAKKLGILLEDYQAEKLDRFAEILTRYNKSVNLTSITEPDEIVWKHFIDSLLVTAAVSREEIKNIADVGAGAGFPSIPIAAVWEGIPIEQIDSSLKRVDFLNYAAKELEIETHAHHLRAEQAGRMEEFREKFDLVVSRALAPLPQLAEYCLPLVKVGGVFCAMKSKKCEEEIEEAKSGIEMLGGGSILEKTWELPMVGTRKLLIIKKERETPEKYPRSSKRIQTKPLK